MHYSLPLLLSAIFISPANPLFIVKDKALTPVVVQTSRIEPVSLSSQSQAQGRMSAIEFKSQEFCRAELKDFEFDIRFTVVSATVYFSGAGFESVQQGKISSNSLKPIAKLKAMCKPGSIVIFDDVKVKGPDNDIRPIDGVTYMLY